MTCSSRSAAAVQAEARTWINTPVLHRQALKGVAVDCVNLMIETGVACDVVDRPEPGSLGAKLLLEYGRLPNPKRLIAGLCAHMLYLGDKDCADWRPGDVVALSWGDRDMPMHIAILAEFEGRTTIIQAYPLLRLQIDGRTKPRVREITYGADWPDRACSYWRYPRLVV